MILTPVYCSSEPPPASGPVRSKMTPILIFFSWASAPTAIPSMAIAADSPTRRRAALRPGMESSLGLFFVHCVLWFLLPPITLVARPDVKRIARDDSAQAVERQSCTSRLGSELRFKKRRDKARHRRIEIAR